MVKGAVRRLLRTRALGVGVLVVGVVGAVVGWGSGGAGAAPARGGVGVPVPGAAGLPVPGAVGVPVPGAPGQGEADLAYHGRAALSGGRVRVVLTPENHGPWGVADATLRVRVSAPLGRGARLPQACVRSGERAVLCRTGPLAAGARGEPLELVLPLRGGGREVTVTVDTAWGGGAVDGNPANDHRVVLALDTGDAYYF
ncbi:hypothetical protein [Streptomyces sp. G45]|uniref:hypothetical protein n=1 Tax=Streptomyces sp. G45 TaxID=3406627 RepID=UPI003C27D9C4